MRMMVGKSFLVVFVGGVRRIVGCVGICVVIVGIFGVGRTGTIVVGRLGAGAVFVVAVNRGVGDLSRRIVMEDATVEYCTDMVGCVVGEGGDDHGSGIR